MSYNIIRKEDDKLQNIKDIDIRFKYYIIIPQVLDTKKPTIDTMLIKFDNNIIRSILILNFILNLPVDYMEYITHWPIDRNMWNDLNYFICYLHEDKIQMNHFEIFKDNPLGCIFIMKGVEQEIIHKIRNVSSFPIVNCDNKNYEGVFPLADESIHKIYKIWNKFIKDNLNVIDNDFGGDKTEIPGYKAPGRRYLNPLTFVIDRIRGLYEKVGVGIYQTQHVEYVNFHKYSEQEADREINKALQFLISEKYLNMIFNYILRGALDKNLESQLSEVGLNLMELVNFLESTNGDKYLEFVSKLIENYEKIRFKTDMVLCVPSVNYEMMKFYLNLFNDDIIKKVYEAFYDTGGYYQYLSVPELDGQDEDKLYEAIKMIGIQRSAEFTMLSELYLFYALGKRIPYIRTRNIAISDIFGLINDLSINAYDLEEYSQVVEFNKIMKATANRIEEYLNNDKCNILSTISKNGSRIKIISDLPIEWIKIDGLPLCLAKRISRIPITPGNKIINHFNCSNNRYKVNSKNLKVLFINTFLQSSSIYRVGKTLYDNIFKCFRAIPNHIEYKEVTNKEDFINVMEDSMPTILIYYGHGEYCQETSMGNLIIGESKISAVELENLNSRPLITILGACETQVLNGSPLNIGNMFLSMGVVSVIGTFFAVHALHTSAFILGLMYQLVGSITGSACTGDVAWDEIIIKAQRGQYLIDAVDALKSYLLNSGDNIDKYVKDIMGEFFTICVRDNIAVENWYRNRDEIFLKIFSDIPVLYKAYKDILDRDLLISNGLFFTSLGSPENIIVERENENFYGNDDMKAFLKDTLLMDYKETFDKTDESFYYEF